MEKGKYVFLILGWTVAVTGSYSGVWLLILNIFILYTENVWKIWAIDDSIKNVLKEWELYHDNRTSRIDSTAYAVKSTL